MKGAFDPIAAIAEEAARAALPEQVHVGSVTPLPRGADPFVGAERPLLLAATRWTFVAPGGVLLGGAPAAMAAVLGFEVPATPSAEERSPVEGPAVKWSDLVADAARETATTVTQAIASAIAPVADLPPDCSATQVSVSDSDAAIRAEVGPIPDGVVLMLHAGDYEVRLLVVVPGIMVARLGSPEADQAPAEPIGAGAGETQDAADASTAAAPLRGLAASALSAVPLELSIGVGHARVPLAHVLDLKEGEVLELEESVDSPVDLISGGAAVAHGELEVSDHGTLVLHVTGIPGRRTASGPSLVADPLLAAQEAASVAASGTAADELTPDDPAEPDAPSAEPPAAEEGLREPADAPAESTIADEPSAPPGEPPTGDADAPVSDRTPGDDA